MKAAWRCVVRVQRTVKRSALGQYKARHRPILGHGTDKLGPLPVAEQIIGASLDLCRCESRRIDHRHAVLPPRLRRDCFPSGF